MRSSFLSRCCRRQDDLGWREDSKTRREGSEIERLTGLSHTRVICFERFVQKSFRRQWRREIPRSLLGSWSEEMKTGKLLSWMRRSSWVKDEETTEEDADRQALKWLRQTVSDEGSGMLLSVSSSWITSLPKKGLYAFSFDFFTFALSVSSLLLSLCVSSYYFLLDEERYTWEERDNTSSQDEMYVWCTSSSSFVFFKKSVKKWWSSSYGFSCVRNEEGSGRREGDLKTY